MSPAEHIRESCRHVAQHFYGERGPWAYDCFERIRARYFDDRLPWPLITWALTPHGACLGYSSLGDAPTITLHPSLLGGTESDSPWRVPPDLLGVAFAYDVLLHECIHMEYVLGGWRGHGTTSHNNDPWVAELNRLAPLLGFDGFVAGRSRLRRVPDPTCPDGPKRVARVTDSNLPFAQVASFPHAVRIARDQEDYYRLHRTALPPDT